MITATPTGNLNLKADYSFGCIQQLLAIAVLAAGFMVSPVKADESVSLAGTWRFQLDRADAGQSERWFERALPERVQLPGALQNQGFGDEISTNTQWTGSSGIQQWLNLPKYEKYRQPGNVKLPFFLQPEKHYVGAAWYQRDIEIPQGWQGRRVVLTLERPHWATQVWLDEKPVGTNVSLFTPHVYDLGVGLTPGKHRLSIRVDNRMQVCVGARAHSVSDETQGNWNGVVGELKLTTTSPVWLDDVQAYPSLSAKTARLKIRIGNDSGKPGKGVVTVGSVRQPVEWTAAGGVTELEVALGSEAKSWDEFNPALQRLDVKLSGDGAADEQKLVFGLREFGVKERQFILNGRPTFFRGTLECAIFPLTGYPPTDVAAWKRIIRICQAHGLNHIRFHSWCPPEAAFVAADDLGFYYQVELAWLGGRDTSRLGDGQPVDQWLYDEAARVLKTYGNHPSFLMMAYGNEPHGTNQVRWLGDWVNHWKQADPRRLHTSGAGWPMIPESQYHVMFHMRGFQGWLGRDYREALEKGPWARKLQPATVQQIDIPVVAHELGEWCAYPNFDEMVKYTGPLKPKNFEIFRDSLVEHGMLRQAKDFMMASGKLQALCYKEDIEATLRTPGVGGIQMLDLHDFPGQGTALVGVLDPFWDSKGYISAAEYHRFYSATVPLARLLRRTWTSAETLTAEVEVAHFGAAPLANARPYWKVVSTGGQVAASGELPALTVPLGQGTKLGQISLALGKLPAPAQYKLVVGLTGTTAENDWNFWVYPAESPAPPAAVLVTQSLNASARERLAAGGKVLLMSGLPGTESFKLSFETVFWNNFMLPNKSRQTLGLLCNTKHPALAQFPTEFFQDWQWHDIVTSGSAVVLDNLPRELQPIVQPIDDWNTNRKLGLLFECKVGKGKLLVCAADLAKDLERRPAARQLRASLLAYAASAGFNPKVEVALAKVDKIPEVATVASALVKLGAQVIESDSQVAAYPAGNAIDGKADTFWHTPWGAEAKPMPHHLVIDLGGEVLLSGLKYLPRQASGEGRCADCEVFCSNDPKAWGAAVASVRWENNDRWQTLQFKKTVKARYLKLVVKSAVKNSAYTHIAEIDIITP